MAEGAGEPWLRVEEVLAAAEEEEDHPCSLVEASPGGPRRAQQGGPGRENLEGEVGHVKSQSVSLYLRSDL